MVAISNPKSEALRGLKRQIKVIETAMKDPEMDEETRLYLSLELLHLNITLALMEVL